MMSVSETFPDRKTLRIRPALGTAVLIFLSFVGIAPVAGQVTGLHTCGIPVGSRGTPIQFADHGPGYDAALAAIANQIPEIQRTAKMSYEQATKVEGAVIPGRHGNVLLFRGANGYFCGAMHCFIGIYKRVGGGWQEPDTSTELADNAYAYPSKNGYPALSANVSITEDSYVLEFSSKAGNYQLCEAESRVPLKEEGGTFVVPVVINDAITLNFTVDSGASDVSIPVDVFSTLIRAGTIEHSDITGTNTYVIADGTTLRSTTFQIRSLKIGKLRIRNVSAVVAPANGTLLLGQSFLKQFKAWSLDNANHELVLK